MFERDCVCVHIQVYTVHGYKEIFKHLVHVQHVLMRIIYACFP